MLLSTLTGCSFFQKDDGEDELKDFYSIGQVELAQYTIIRPDEADEETIAAASKLCTQLQQKYGLNIIFTTDYVGRNETVPTDTKEILVGLTNREESKGLRYLDYEIAYVNDRVVINGGSGAAVTEAVEEESLT